MKKKIIALMLFVITLLCAVHGFVLAEASDAEGTGGGTTHTCVYDKKNTSSDYRRSYADCDSSATYYYSCSCGAKGTSYFRSGSPNGHDWGDWTYLDENNHIKYCDDCDETSIVNHNYNSWVSINENQHRRLCQSCTDVDTESHDKNKAIDSAISGVERDEYHKMVCSKCDHWDGSSKALHTWSDAGHTCTAETCSRTHSTREFHYYGFSNGDALSATYSRCQLKHCSHEIRLAFVQTVEGLPINNYTASDAVVEMGKVPEFKPGTYHIKWNTSNVLYDKDYNKVTKLTILEGNVRIYGWNQRTILTHCYSAEAYLEEREKALSDQIDMWGNPRLGDMADAAYELERVKASLEELRKIIEQLELHVITPEMVQTTEEYFENWPSEYRLSCRDTILNDAVEDPTQKYNSSTNTFELKYDHDPGGWMFMYSPFFPGNNFEFTELFQYGSYTPDPPEQIYGNVFVYYRTLNGAIPKGNWSAKDYVEQKCIYNKGPIVVSGTKSIDAGKTGDAWKNGYRVVGHTVQICATGKGGPASSPAKSGNTASYTIKFEPDASCAHITFFVDEAEADVKYCYRNIDDNSVPYGGFKNMYELATLTAWNNGASNEMVQKTSVTADVDGLIWPNAYRYIGYAITKGDAGNVSPARYPTATNPAETANIEEDFQDYYRTEIIVTFFVKPAELTVRYCYRTTENELPNYAGTGYRYQEFYDTYKPNPVKSWTGGVKNQTVKIDPDMELIYGTGYRYVGFSVVRTEKGKSTPAVYPNGLISSSPATHTDDFDSSKTRYTGIDEAEIMITFFVRNAEADILYCYRTPDNLVPTNGAHETYEEFYYDYDPNPITSWHPDDNGGELTFEVKKAADLVKIDNTGYRYLGYKIARAEKGTRAPAPYGEDLDPDVEAVWLEDFDSSKAPQYPNCLYHPEIIITFFIEPVKGYYGQLWRDEDGDITKDQAFRYKEGTEYQNRTGFEFRNYYDPTLEKCSVNVSTFNKFIFPGEILIGAEVMDYKYIDPVKMLSDADLYNPWTPDYSKGNEIWLKTYDASTTTQWAPLMGDTSRLQLSEPFYSSYISNHPKVPISGIVNEERQGFAVDKQFWFVYNTPLTEVLHVNYPNESEFMLDVNGSPIKGTIHILNEFAFLESLCTDAIGIPKHIGIGDSYFTYTAIGYNVKEIEIFEKTSAGLVSRATITKDNYPSYNGVFDKSFVEQYINIQSNINSDLLNANKNWRIVFKYEYKPELVQTKLTIKYKLNSVTGEDLQDPTEVLINSGDSYKVNVPTNLAGCVPEYYVRNSDPTQRTDFNNIIVIGDPLTGNQTIIIVYVPSRPQEIVFNFGQNVVLRANIKGDEEYDVEKAVPTSEDLYVSGDMYSYKFEENIEKKEETKTVRVKVVQRYYLDSENKTVGNTGSVSTDVFNVGLTYQYYDVLKAELYDLEEMLFENDGVKFYHDYNKNTAAYTDYEEGKATWNVDKKNPYIDYNEPTEEERIQITVNAADGMSFDGSVYTIVLPTIADVKPEKTDLDKQFNTSSPGIALEILRRNTDIYLTRLILKEDGKPEVTILTGNNYRLNMITNAMAEKVNYIPFELDRAPMYSFVKDQGLFVQEKALNQEYKSKITGTYLLASEVLGSVAENHETSIATRGLAKVGLSINSIFVHTPIVNDVTMKINEKLNQLISGVTTLENIVVLDEGLDITIKNSINFNNEKGYKNKEYNHNGLLADDEGAKKNAMLINKSDGAVQMNASDYEDETEEKTVGPAFAEYKLIKFPYDVYLVSGESNEGGTKRMEMPRDGSILFKANEWYNLYEYIPVRTEKYHFVVPVWVEDAKEYTGVNGIHVLLVAENCDEATLTAAKNNPMSVKLDKKNTDKNVYILRTSFDTYVAGRIYDLRIRDTDDPGFMNKIKPALSGDEGETVNELPIAQKGQVKNYNLGMKLGYRFYFDLKTKGIANKFVNLHPTIYYVPADGSAPTTDISLFYHSKGNLYNKLSESDLSVKMSMAGTHGIVNNPGYTLETVTAKQLVTSRVFTNVEIIGNILGGLSLERDKEKLPYDNILECSNAYGFADDTTTFITSAEESDSVNGANSIKDATGHWYGEYYLPASTIVAQGENTSRQELINGSKKPYTTGYLVVVFRNISTVEHDPEVNYLTYAAPSEETQYVKEGIDSVITLPNGNKVTIPEINVAPMAIYQVGLRANNDYETEGTH